jgi:hypothetical protein|tara:strand:- start:1237 stop:5019 length:3783 start_codon:yes stop_codon:yes gene_type:complete
MAKNKIAIDVKVDDKGTTKKVGVQAKKAAKGLDDVGASAHTANRNMKGVSQQSSSGTKNFSKMAQGMGGIVGVYATLAAQAFALSAAFEFLKKVGDLRVLKDSQVAYASSTGLAITSLSRDIRSAADGMLNFEEASKSAAIGLSSGLNAGQLTKLAEGAAAVSKVLGRDVSDSYDRLVRGVTKAEPELLDELGITLRLEDAKNKYAIAIGKTVKELSLLEAKQAVAVEVQSQLDKKFISTTSSIEIQGNAMAKFGVAFNDLFVKFAGFIEGPVDAAATFFADNIKSLIAIIGLFALSIIKTMLPSLDSFRARAVESAEQASIAFNKTKASYDALKASTSQGVIKGALQDVDAPAGSGVDRLKNGKEINKRQAAALLKYAKMEKGVYQKLTKYQQTVYVKALQNILGKKETFWQKAKRGWYGLGTVIDRTAQRAAVAWKAAMVKITAATTMAVKAMNRAMQLIGWLGIATLIADAVSGVLDFLGVYPKATRALEDFQNSVEETREELRSLGTEYGKLTQALTGHLNKVHAMSDGDIMAPTISSYKTLGNAAATTFKALAKLQTQLDSANEMETAGFEGGIAAFSIFNDDDWADSIKEAQKSATLLAKELIAAGEHPAFEKLFENIGSMEFMMGKFADATKSAWDPKSLKQFADEFQNLVDVTTTFEESYSNSNLTFDKFVQGISQYKTSVTDMLVTTGKEIDTLTSKVGLFGQALLNTDAAVGQIASLTNRLAFLTLINNKETKAKTEQLSADRHSALLMHGMTKLVQQRLSREKSIVDLTIKYEDSLRTQASLNEKNLTVSAEEKILIEQKTSALKEQLDMATKANTNIYRIGMSFWQGFEDGAVTNLSALIKGEKTSFKEAVLGTLLEGLGATADQIASELVETMMSDLLKRAKKETPEQKMARSMVEAATAAGILWDDTFKRAAETIRLAIVDGAAKAATPVALNTKMGSTSGISAAAQEDLNSSAVEFGTETIALRKKLEEEQLAAAAKFNELQNLGQTKETALWIRNADAPVPKEAAGAAYPSASEEFESVSPKLPNTPVEKDDQFGTMIPIGATKNNTKSNLINSDEVSTNSGALGKATGVIDNAMGTNGTFVTEMKAGFNNSLTHLASIIGSGGSTSSRGILSTLLQTTVSAVMGSYFPPTARAGGIISKGKKVPGYATGGIAKGSTSGYPATLHGTEAVVPLGTGRAIPVDMKGSGGSTNNIVVNISTEGQSSTEGSTGPDMEKMGGAIARAVQEELHNQKRSGGILNPYGVA